MTISFGRTAGIVLPLLAAATLGAATLANAGTARPVAPVNHPASAHHGLRHVKRNAGSGPVYYTGGATLPAVAYVGATQAVAGQPNPANVPGAGTTGTVLGYFASTYSPNHGADSFTYCQTGSGFGKSVMNGDNDNTNTPHQNADLPCATPVGTGSVKAVNGFGAVGQAFGDFSGSDAPLSITEYTDWSNNQANPADSIFGRGLPFQVPYIIGSIALLYNNSDPVVEASQINLTNQTICKIADGEITNWNQISKKYASKTLSFALRSDKSGTSFSFANRLNATCTGAGETYGVSQNYDEYYPGNPSIGALPNPLPAGATTANFLPASGNGGVTAAIEATDGAIGYVETANALTAVNGSNLQFAKVEKQDPVQNLPKAAGTIKPADLVTGETIGSDVANGRAALQPVSDSCVLMMNPITYAKPAQGYPIIAVTNLEFSQTGNGPNVADLQALASMVSQNGAGEAVGSGKITSIDLYGHSNVGTTGYSTLNQAKFHTTIKNAATSCIGA